LHGNTAKKGNIIRIIIKAFYDFSYVECDTQFVRLLLLLLLFLFKIIHLALKLHYILFGQNETFFSKKIW